MMDIFGKDDTPDEVCNKFIDVEKSCRALELDDETKAFFLKSIEDENSVLWKQADSAANEPENHRFDKLFLKAKCCKALCDRLGQDAHAHNIDLDLVCAKIRLAKQLGQCSVQVTDGKPMLEKSVTEEKLISLLHATAELEKLTHNMILTTQQSEAVEFAQIVLCAVVKPHAVSHARAIQSSYDAEEGDMFEKLCSGNPEKNEVWSSEVPADDWFALAEKAASTIMKVDEKQLHKLMTSAQAKHTKLCQHVQTFGLAGEEVRATIAPSILRAQITLWERRLLNSYLNAAHTLVDMRRETRAVMEDMKAEKKNQASLHSGLVVRMKQAAKLKPAGEPPAAES